jgi:hypothetical protein
MVESFRPPWAEQAPPVFPEAWVGDDILPEPGDTRSSEALVAPPRPSQVPGPGTPTAATRRASLAESRRLGLGNPTRRSDAAPASARTDDPADPADVRDGQDDEPDPARTTLAVPCGEAETPVASEARTGTAAEAAQDLSDRIPPIPAAPPVIASPETHGPSISPASPPVVADHTDHTDQTVSEHSFPAAHHHAPTADRTAPAGQRLVPGPVYRFVSGERSVPAERSVVAAAPVVRPPKTGGMATHLPREGSVPRPRATRRPVPAPGTPDAPPRQTAPADLARAVQQALGTDVSDVLIHRGPQATAEAKALGALAFTRDAEVFLPAEAGPLDQPVARGLLAHELTHAAQQRRLGSALPPEDSEAGAVLEAQAVDSERWTRGLGAPLRPDGTSTMASWTAPWPVETAGPPVETAPWPVGTSPWPAGSASGVQRQTGEVTAPAPPPSAPLQAPTTPMAVATAFNGVRPLIGAGHHEPGQPPPPAGTVAPGQPAGAKAPEGTTAQTQLSFEQEPGDATDGPAQPATGRPLDLDDPGDIEELAVRVYQKIQGRLRRELVVDRERAGRLAETGAFGWAR